VTVAHSGVTIRAARGAADLAAAATLFREYAAWLGVDLSFQDFAAEVAALPGRYAPPDGEILLAFVGGALAGCVAMRPLPDEHGAPTLCEMKRLWVRGEFKGRKVGRLLSEAIIALARDRGYRAMRLDTLKRLVAANRLYRSAGFRPIAAYYHNPEPDVLYFELTLGAGEAERKGETA